MFFLLHSKSYIAVIGDMKCSKKLHNRSQVQDTLKNALEDINTTFRDDLASRFIITLGDEFQGLLRRGANVMQIISMIQNALYPVEIRFGMGIGTISTDINWEMSIGADGPAYYKAREAIDSLKMNEKKKQSGAADIRLGFQEEDQGTIVMINTLLSLMTVIRRSWSDRQREVIWDMLKHQDSQAEVARRLKIKQPTVQKLLARGNYYEYKEALDVIKSALGEIQQDDL